MCKVCHDDIEVLANNGVKGFQSVCSTIDANKTGMFCKYEHRAREIEAPGIDYTIETICSITKKVWAKDARKRKRGPRTKAMCDTVDRKQGLP